MLSRLYRALGDCVNLLLPPACPLCYAPLSGATPRAFCEACSARIQRLAPGRCRRCAQPYDDPQANHLCGHCLQRPPAFASACAVGLYSGALSESIHRLKYRGRVNLAKPLGELLAGAVKEQAAGFRPECIMPVPLHPDRLRRRGFNQSLELARPLARETGLPLMTRELVRTLPTRPQQGLALDQRRHNLANAFNYTPSGTPPASVLLIDDVMTTGETARACSRALIDAGAVKVMVAVICRA
jgi:ComF family protein